MFNGRKLWTTNGTVADVLVVMAKVPRSEGRRGGITAFIVPSDTDGVEVEARIEFMGLRGIENSQTRYTDVYVPKENVIGKEGQGLKIALATLNTGRLALPAVCAGVCKWATKIAREFASQRVQWGKPIGEHDEVAQRIAFIAATAFGLEAMLDVTSRLADEKRNDVRIEAALAKLYGCEMGWRVVDELMQVCGGRGYETAGPWRPAACAACRSSRPCATCASTASSRARRRSCTSSSPARRWTSTCTWPGTSWTPKSRPRARRRRSARPVRSTPTGTRELALGRGQDPGSYAEYGELAGHMRFVERTSRKLARSTFYGMARWQAGTEGHGAFLDGSWTSAPSCSPWPRPWSTPRRRCGNIPSGRPRPGSWPRPSATRRSKRTERLFHELWSNADEPNHQLALDVLKGRHTWLEEGIIDPSAGDGPMVPSAETDPGFGSPVPRRRSAPSLESDTHLTNSSERDTSPGRRDARVDDQSTRPHARLGEDMVEVAMELTEPRVFIENRTFDEIEVGATATLERTLSREDIELFARGRRAM